MNGPIRMKRSAYALGDFQKLGRQRIPLRLKVLALLITVYEILRVRTCNIWSCLVMSKDRIVLAARDARAQIRRGSIKRRNRPKSRATQHDDTNRAPFRVGHW